MQFRDIDRITTRSLRLLLLTLADTHNTHRSKLFQNPSILGFDLKISACDTLTLGPIGISFVKVSETGTPLKWLPGPGVDSTN